MDSNELTIKAGFGDQTSAGGRDATQPAGQLAAGGTPISSVQPSGATSGLFRSQDQKGITLTSNSLPGIELTSVPSNPASVQAPDARDINPALFGVSGLLLVIAIVLFWTTTASSKKNNVKNK